MLPPGTYFALLPPELWRLTLRLHQRATDAELDLRIEELDDRVPGTIMLMSWSMITLALLGGLIGRGRLFLALALSVFCGGLVLQVLLKLRLTYQRKELFRVRWAQAFWLYPWSPAELSLVTILLGFNSYIFYLYFQQ